MNWKLIRIIDALAGIPLIRLVSFLRMFRRQRNAEPGKGSPRKILLVKFWGIGNIVMLLPSIQALRNAFPDAEIDFLTLESNRDALETLDIADRVAAVDTGSAFRFLRSWRRAVKTLSAAGYDLAIDFEQFARFSALITFQTGAPATIGFATRKQHRHYLYSRAVEYDNHTHIVKSFYGLAAAAGVDRSFSADIRLGSLETLRSRGERLLQDHGIGPDEPLVVMHIGTSDNFRERRWPPAHFAALADLLIGKLGMAVVMTGLPDEAFLITETMKLMDHSPRVRDFGGKLAFADYYGLIAAADMVVSADTAAVHLASAVNVPVVGLYGPNTPLLYGPWGAGGKGLYAGLGCSPCITNFNSKINVCRHPSGRGACMAALSVDEVFAAVEQISPASDAPLRRARSAGKGSTSCVA